MHTVGQDIKQALDAQAAVTVSKDTNFRDYSQACWRMRGIGRGQEIHLYLIAEVLKLVRRVARSGCLERDVVAWLIVNSVRSERLQYVLTHVTVYHTAADTLTPSSPHTQVHATADTEHQGRVAKDSAAGACAQCCTSSLGAKHGARLSQSLHAATEPVHRLKRAQRW